MPDGTLFDAFDTECLMLYLMFMSHLLYFELFFLSDLLIFAEKRNLKPAYNRHNHFMMQIGRNSKHILHVK